MLLPKNRNAITILIFVIMLTSFSQCAKSRLQKNEVFIMIGHESQSITFEDILDDSKYFLYYTDINCLFCPLPALGCPDSSKFNVVHVGSDTSYARRISYVFNLPIYIYHTQKFSDELKKLVGIDNAIQTNDFPLLIKYSGNIPVSIERSVNIPRQLGERQVCDIVKDFIHTD